MDKQFTFMVASDQEREKVFCEIYFQDEIMAEVSQEDRQLTLVIFAPPSKWWEVPFDGFQEALGRAKHLLLGPE